METFEPSYDESEYDYAADNDYSYDEKHSSLVEPTSPLSETQLANYHTNLGFSSELAYTGPNTANLKLSGSQQFDLPHLSELPSVDHSSVEDDQLIEPTAKRRKLTELGTTAIATNGLLSPAPSPFTDEEDAAIVNLHEIHGENWAAIAAALTTKRDPRDVKDRWRKLREKARRKTRRVAPSASPSSHSTTSTDFGGRVHRYPINKRFWSAEEDAKLRELVELHGAHNWPKIAQHMDGRSDNDCHSRWSRHLDPRLNKQPFSSEEDAMILELQRKMGNHWKDIAVALSTNRSGVQIHGRWLHLSKKERKANPVVPTPPPTKPKRGRKPGSTNANRTTQTKIPKKRGRRPKVQTTQTNLAQPATLPSLAGTLASVPRIHVEPDPHQDGAVSAPETYFVPGQISSTEEFSGDWANDAPGFEDEYGMMSDSGIAY